MNTPLVSVLMTAYNREKYIAEAIESVIEQIYFNWELIIVDDCSKDETLTIARSYEQKDHRIKVFVNEKNLGDYQNRNKAASYARGIYLKYLDADDMMYPHTITAMVSAMENYSDAAYGFSYFGPQADMFRYPVLYSPREAYRKHFFGESFFYAGPGGAIIRKKYFDEVGGFSGARFIGDTELWFKLSAKYNCVQFWPTLIYWRKHDEQESKIEQNDGQIHIIRFNLIMDVITKKTPLTGVEVNLVRSNYTRIYCRKILQYFFSGNFKISWSLFKGADFNSIYFFTSIIPVNRILKIFGRNNRTP